MSNPAQNWHDVEVELKASLYESHDTKLCKARQALDNIAILAETYRNDPQRAFSALTQILDTARLTLLKTV